MTVFELLKRGYLVIFLPKRGTKPQLLSLKNLRTRPELMDVPLEKRKLSFPEPLGELDWSAVTPWGIIAARI